MCAEWGCDAHGNRGVWLGLSSSRLSWRKAERGQGMNPGSEHSRTTPRDSLLPGLSRTLKDHPQWLTSSGSLWVYFSLKTQYSIKGEFFCLSIPKALSVPIFCLYWKEKVAYYSNEDEHRWQSLLNSLLFLFEIHLEHEEGHKPSLLLLSLLRENFHAMKLVKCLPISKKVSVAWETYMQNGNKVANKPMGIGNFPRWCFEISWTLLMKK